MKGDDEKCIAAGCDGYLSKPVRGEQIIEMLARFLPAPAGENMAAGEG
jgi:CheY-like chemotaxis protein